MKSANWELGTQANSANEDTRFVQSVRLHLIQQHGSVGWKHFTMPIITESSLRLEGAEN